jgi:hypothetical protein
MKIRPRYAKTLMMAHRRSQSPALRRANAYNAFVTRIQYGRHSRRYYWHKKVKPLTEESLIDAIRKIPNVAGEPKRIYVEFK